MSLARPRVALAAAAAGTTLTALACTGQAHAALVPFGSSLTGQAMAIESHQVDTVFWHTEGPASLAAPSPGMVKAVRVKGMALGAPSPGAPGGETLWHLQALKLQPDGRYLILRTSQGFELPATGDPGQITTYVPTDFCVGEGEFLAYNTVGGFGPAFPSGTPLQIFAETPGVTMQSFEGRDATDNNETIQAGPTRNRELLMQAVVGTGTDAGFCPTIGKTPAGGGGTTGGGGGGTTTTPKTRKMTVPSQRLGASKKGKVSVAVYCPAGTESCKGKVSLLSRGRGKARSYGSKSITVKPKKTGKATIQLNKAGRNALKRTGSAKVTLRVVMSPGGSDRTSSRSITLRRR